MEEVCLIDDACDELNQSSCLVLLDVIVVIVIGAHVVFGLCKIVIIYFRFRSRPRSLSSAQGRCVGTHQDE